VALAQDLENPPQAPLLPLERRTAGKAIHALQIREATYDEGFIESYRCAGKVKALINQLPRLDAKIEGPGPSAEGLGSVSYT
jgi:hypothetical protein